MNFPEFNSEPFRNRVEMDPTLIGIKELYVDPNLETSEVCNLANQLNRHLPTVYHPGLFESESDPFESEQQPVIVTRNSLETYAEVFGINTADKSDLQLAQEIKNKAPCTWIQRVKDWAQTTPLVQYLNRYVTDEMMMILSNLRRNQWPLVQPELDLIVGVNQAIYASPRPHRGFTVYRGIYGQTDQNLAGGEVVTLDTPKSGSFSLEVLTQGYVNYDIDPPCCIVQIFVPNNAIVSYHPSEDQVIFPTGAQFYVLTGAIIQNPLTFGKRDPITYYQMIYIDAPPQPQVIINPTNFILPDPPVDSSSPYSKLSLRDAYMLAYLRNLPFPYGTDPYSLLLQADQQDHRFINRIKSGHPDLNNPAEVRFYLSILGYDISSAKMYDSAQMREVIRRLFNI